jgi:hypothetical protein
VQFFFPSNPIRIPPGIENPRFWSRSLVDCVLREIEDNQIGTIRNNINFSARRAQEVLNCTQILDEHTVGSRFSQQGLPLNQCQHCAAIKWPLDASTTCCNNGKIRTAIFPEPPNEIKDLWLGTSEESRIFRENSRILNNALALASQKVTEIRPPGGGC